MALNRRPRSYTWDLWRTARRGTPAILQKQAERLADIVDFARTQSPYYRRHYGQLPERTYGLEELPPVTRQDIMTHFDEWVTDPEVTKQGVDKLTADYSLLGKLFLDRYTVARTSGSIWVWGTMLQDSEASRLYDALIIRGWPGFPNMLRDWMGYLRHGFRSAYIISTRGHYGTVVAHERLRQEHSRFGNRLQRFSSEDPLPQTVRALNEYQPTHVVAFTGVAQSLAYEQIAGRLAIHPVNVVVGGETLEPGVRIELEKAFRCTIRDIYSTNEFPYLAFDCRYNWLHLNTDWAILEPIDRNYQGVPPGQLSHNALLTNLINRVQPYIRYELGDSVLVRPDPCPCGNPFPAIRVQGRMNEVLTLTDAEGHKVMLTWLVFGAAIQTGTPVVRYQVIQTTPDCLHIRLELEANADRISTWQTVLDRLTTTRADNNLRGLKIIMDPELPRPDPKTGKYRRVWRQNDH